MLKFLLELVYMCSFEFVVHLVNVGGDLSWWSNEWSLFCFQRAHVISGLRHVWSFIALTVMWIVDIYHIYPSLANTKTFLPQQRTKREQYLTLVSKPNTLKTCVTTGMGLISKCSCHWCEGLLFKPLCTYFHVVQGCVYCSKVIRRILLKFSMGD